MIQITSINNSLIRKIYKKDKSKLVSISPVLPNRFNISSFPPLYVNEEIYFEFQAQMSNLLFSDSYFSLSIDEFNKQKEKIESNYINNYKNKVLNKLNVNAVYSELDNKILICCDCFNNSLCHRFIIMEWFHSNNYSCDNLSHNYLNENCQLKLNI